MGVKVSRLEVGAGLKSHGAECEVRYKEERYAEGGAV